MHEWRARAQRLIGTALHPPTLPPVLQSMARLSPFEVGQIKAHLYHGLGPRAIAGLVKMSDGTNVSVQGVCDTKAKLDGDPSWRGEELQAQGAPGRPSPQWTGSL